jgi:hypothetical protein
MKFKYLGKDENMVAFGYDFSEGQTPDVTDGNAIARLTGNPYFEAVGGDINDEGRMNVRDTLLLIPTASLETLDQMAEGEDRKTVLNAIEKQRAALTA